MFFRLGVRKFLLHLYPYRPAPLVSTSAPYDSPLGTVRTATRRCKRTSVRPRLRARTSPLDDQGGRCRRRPTARRSRGNVASSRSSTTREAWSENAAGEQCPQPRGRRTIHRWPTCTASRVVMRTSAPRRSPGALRATVDDREEDPPYATIDDQVTRSRRRL